MTQAPTEVDASAVNAYQPAPGMQWYVVHAYSGMEKSVGRAIQERIDRAGMQSYFGRILVPTEEVIEVCRPLAAHHGLYCTHMRDESDHVMDALEETFRIGREVGVPVVISHHKVQGTANHGRSLQTLSLIERRP